MARYSLVFKRSVAKDLRALSGKDVKRILRRIGGLAEDSRPPGCEKLSGKECYRVRQGACRIIYLAEDEQVCVIVVKVAHRQDVYRA